MSNIPLYVVTGFLSTGKTRLIRDILPSRLGKPLLIHCEQGLTPNPQHSIFLDISPETTSAQLDALVQEVLAKLAEVNPTEIWLEWNGMVPFELLEKLCYQTALAQKVSIAKVIYVATPMYIDTMLGKTGAANLSQLANADFAVILGAKASKTVKNSQFRLKQFHPRLPIHSYEIPDSITLPEASNSMQAKINAWFAEKNLTEHELTPVLKPTPDKINRSLWGALFLALCAYGWLYTEGSFPTIPQLPKLLTVFGGIFLQAFPFLLLGIMISTGIQLFLPPTFIQRALTGNPVKTIILALIGGFLFPICDCATIPIFRSLLMRKVPIYVGLTFMLASPIINPIVILSTYYSFAGNMPYVLGRIVLGCGVAVIVSLTFIRYKGIDIYRLSSLEAIAFQNTYLDGKLNRQTTSRWQSFFINSQNEFFRTGAYLLIGAIVSSGFQVYATSLFHRQNGTSFALAILCMMAFAYLLSLCSTSDAMIGRSLGTFFPLPSVMGFLLFGPIMDIKSTLLLSSLFPMKFVLRLIITCAIVVFIVTSLFAHFLPLV